MGRYIWGTPRSDEYLQAFLVNSHWEQFKVISLEENHRQEKDRDFADMLNRIRTENHTEEDLNMLQTRVRPEGHPDLKGALVIASTHEVVNKHNDRRLEELSSDLIVVDAISSHQNIPNYKPKLHQKKKTVADPPFLQRLCLKIGARVMLTMNMDVADKLSNGSIGTLVAAVRSTQGEIKLLMVKFDNPDAGRELRRCHPFLANKFPGCTPISKQLHKYSTAARSSVKTNMASVSQFALILAFSSTTHKIQGMTIHSPRKVAVDLRSIFRGGANQAYVMLGRCENLSQLYLIGELPEEKIKADKEALDQLAKLKARSINNNPPVWEQQFGSSLKVAYLNIHSLRDKFEDIIADPTFAFGDLLVFGETWLEERDELNLAAILPNYNEKPCYLQEYKISLNSRGRGKGIAAFYKEDKFSVTRTFSDELLQATVFENENICVIGLYRSSPEKYVGMVLANLIPETGNCLIIGDLNICSRAAETHTLFEFLRQRGFHCMFMEATHIEGGALDLVWLRSTPGISHLSSAVISSKYYTAKDHDAVLFTMYNSQDNSKFNYCHLKILLSLILVLEVKESQYGRYQSAMEIKKSNQLKRRLTAVEVKLCNYLGPIVNGLIPGFDSAK